MKVSGWLLPGGHIDPRLCSPFPAVIPMVGIQSNLRFDCIFSPELDRVGGLAKVLFIFYAIFSPSQ
jgi:hypothetical protein